MTLLDCGTWDVDARFFSAQANQQRLSRGQSVECQTSADEGHRADVAGDIEKLVCRIRRQHFI